MSVIIPFRNEEAHLSSLLKGLQYQDYPAGRWDIIFVDDHSTDQSVQVLISGIGAFTNIQILSLPPEMEGKKAAQEIAAAITDAELLLFTDADCVPVETWISSMAACYENNPAVLISGPVIMDGIRSLFSGFQALEFLSLSASGAASFGIGSPVMVNGANLAVRRDVFLDNLSGRKKNIASGDDMFLLLSLKKKYPGKLIFHRSAQAMVKTFPMPDLKSFIYQRLRWTSKAKHYKDFFLITTAWLVMLVNFWLFAGLIYLLFIPSFFPAWGTFFMIKAFIDFVFLIKAAKFTSQESLLNYFVLSQFVYFIYITMIGISGNFSSYRWKGRIISE